MDELATAYGQKWFQDPGPDVGNLEGNASQNLLQGDTGNPMSLIVKVRILLFGFDFPKKTIEHRK